MSLSEMGEKTMGGAAFEGDLEIGFGHNEFKIYIGHPGTNIK